MSNEQATRGSDVACVVLAAGRSSRFRAGRSNALPKQLALWRGETLVHRACRVALGSRLSPTLLVVGYRADEVVAAVEDFAPRSDFEVVRNADWARGQAGSVAAGLSAAPDETSGALFLPVDQPFVDSRTLDLLAARFRDSDKIIVPVAGERRGAPVIFPRRHFDRLAQLEGDQGGRQILEALDHDILTVAVDEALLRDIDQPDELPTR